MIRMCCRLSVFKRVNFSVFHNRSKSTTTCEAIPVLYVKAKNNFEVGFKIGRTFKHFIELHGASRTGRILQAFYNSAQGKEVYSDALAATERYYPHLIEEIRGLSKGSGVPFEKIFLHNMVSDILILHAHDDLVALEDVEVEDDDEQEVAHCSDVLVNTEKCRLIAHNEDWEDDVDNISYLVDIEVDKKAMKESPESEDESEADIFRRKLAKRSERYLSFMFPGNVAGNTFFVTRHFAFTINSLIPTSVNKGAVPVDILVRGLVSCETIEECVAVMENDPVGCSYGININIASRQTKDMWSLEVYPNNGCNPEMQVRKQSVAYQEIGQYCLDIQEHQFRTATQRKVLKAQTDKKAKLLLQGETAVSLERIPYQNKEETPTHYVHTNHYKHLPDAEQVPRIKGSIAREETASQMPTPQSIDEACNILGDLSGEVEPIYKIPGNSLYDKHVKTIATAVLDMNTSFLHLYLQNPKTASRPCLSLPFVE